jgi:hypothetical protein
MAVQSTTFQATVPSSAQMAHGPTVHGPTVKVGQPFDRDNVRWYPVTITDGSEVVNIEAPFTCRELEDDLLSKVLVVDLKEIEGGMAIARMNSKQIIIRVSFDGRNRLTPASFSELRELVLKTTQGLGQNFMESDVKELTMTNSSLFACQIFLSPAIKETVEKVDGKVVSTMTTRSGSCVRGYSTQQALYCLIDKTYTGVLEAHTKAFISSFTVTRL